MSVTDPYRRCIEEIVHPLQISHQRKNTMRRELWTHFLALAEAEGGDESACERAWARMGNPEELRAELDATVTPSERTGYWLDRLVVRKPEEAFGVFALRLGRGWFCFVAALLAAALVAVLLARGTETGALVFVSAVLGPLFVWMFVLLLLLQPAMMFLNDMNALGNSKRPLLHALRKSLACLLGALALSPVFPLSAYALLYSLWGAQHVEVLTYLYMSPLIYGFVWMQVALAILLGTWQSIQTAGPIEGWPYT